MDISATEIERQATRVDEQEERYYSGLNRVIKALYNASSIVESEDSGLSRTMRTYAETCSTLQATARHKFQELSAIMHKYYNETIANEQQASEDIDSLQSEISNISQEIDSIGVVSNNEGYSDWDLGSER